MLVTSTLAYLAWLLVMKEKSFITSTPGVCLVKLFSSSLTLASNKLECLSFESIFCLIVSSLSRVDLLSYRPYPQILDKSEKNKYASFFGYEFHCQINRFITLVPSVNAIKLFFFVTDALAEWAGVFIPDEPFQHIL